MTDNPTTPERVEAFVRWLNLHAGERPETGRALVQHVRTQATALEVAERALSDLGACEDDDCPPPCLKPLHTVRSALRGGEGTTP